MAELISQFERKPWSNDEIGMRINMCFQALTTAKLQPERNEILESQLEREIATWRELLKRRLQ